MDGLSIAMGAVALVLAGVWAVASYGERIAPDAAPAERASPRLGLVLLAAGSISLAYAALLLVADGDLGRFMWHTLGGALLLVVGRDMRRRSHSPT